MSTGNIQTIAQRCPACDQPSRPLPLDELLPAIVSSRPLLHRPTGELVLLAGIISTADGIKAQIIAADPATDEDRLPYLASPADLITAEPQRLTVGEAIVKQLADTLDLVGRLDESPAQGMIAMLLQAASGIVEMPDADLDAIGELLGAMA